MIFTFYYVSDLKLEQLQTITYLSQSKAFLNSPPPIGIVLKEVNSQTCVKNQ